MPLRIKELLLNFFFNKKKVLTAIKLEGRRGVSLNDTAIKKKTFLIFSASLNNAVIMSLKLSVIFTCAEVLK